MIVSQCGRERAKISEEGSNHELSSNSPAGTSTSSGKRDERPKTGVAHRGQKCREVVAPEFAVTSNEPVSPLIETALARKSASAAWPVPEALRQSLHEHSIMVKGGPESATPTAPQAHLALSVWLS